ncbi:SSI family serine proteinase inhibitor [Arthrobacter sp. ISL-72]|uniref:SSI family serine proteinase inhibitor n=1 Tax=Arthrobacter sp. ISL-72 TaxID=2819114 RepID=UPI001BEA897C|nr:SSI family serine proteinase inhibitor [Arthrobacter sp. ISL-72]MBT2597591.1 serine protease inhibitor [Arthrobacter sp. ISL-72]
MRKAWIHALVLVSVAGLAACSPDGGTPAPSPSTATTGGATTSAEPSATPSPDTETTVPAPSPPPSSLPPRSGPGKGNAELAIVVKPSESEAAQNYTLVCKDGVPTAESSHPSAAAACAALKDNPAVLSPEPRSTDQACTQQYGGPQEATVTGIVDDVPVDTSFARRDGCEIGLWNGAKDILGSAGGAT